MQAAATASICGLLGQLGQRQAPDAAEGRIEQLEAAVGAEHRDAFLQRVERLALHPRQGVILRFQRETLGDIVEKIGDPALRIGIEADAQGAAVGQVPDLRRRLEGVIELEQGVFPAAVIGLFGQAAGGAQPVENFGIAGTLVEKGQVERPQLAIGGVGEDQLFRPGRKSRPPVASWSSVRICDSICRA